MLLTFTVLSIENLFQLNFSRMILSMNNDRSNNVILHTGLLFFYFFCFDLKVAILIHVMSCSCAAQNFKTFENGL